MNWLMKFKTINEGMSPWTIPYFILSSGNIIKNKSYAVLSLSNTGIY